MPTMNLGKKLDLKKINEANQKNIQNAKKVKKPTNASNSTPNTDYVSDFGRSDISQLDQTRPYMITQKIQALLKFHHLNLIKLQKLKKIQICG